MRNLILLGLIFAVLGCGKSVQTPASTVATAGQKVAAQEWFNRGNELRPKDREKALFAYSESIRLDPSFDRAYFNRALLHSEMGRDKEAMADYQVLKDRKSESAPKLKGLFAGVAGAYLSIGNDACEKGDLELALSKYKAAAIYDPEYANAYIGRGIVYQKKGKVDDAITEFQHAIELDPKSAIAHLNCGEAYLEQSKFDKAIESLTKAIELNPQEAAAYTSRAAAYEGSKDKVKAQEDRAAASRLKDKQSK
jgi:Tfp pilus assembly protein PilF